MQLSLIPQLKHTNSANFFLLAGPCAIEGEDMAMRIAEQVVSDYRRIANTLRL